MGDNHCPLCSQRISNWESAGGKTIFVRASETTPEREVHKACLIDFKQKTGKDYAYWG